MNELIVEKVGKLDFVDDHWECWGVPSTIGPVDLQVDSISIDQTSLPEKIRSIFSQIETIDSRARGYLTSNMPSDELVALGELIEPSILLLDENAEGNFTLFYSCSENEDAICGVEFFNYEPYDLTIGD
jgi:hypothetical protein